MKVITFSRFFPANHPRKGEPTYFVEKIARGLHSTGVRPFDIPYEIFSTEIYYIVDGKHHTIRAGNRWKVGDVFSPRVWSGKPYASKQIEFAPPIEIKIVIPIGLRFRGDFQEFYCNDCYLTSTSIIHLAQNDGLEVKDFLSWFPKPFEGQIICWNESINY